MILAAASGLLAILFPAPSDRPSPMPEARPALRLDVEQRDGNIEVRLIGDAAQTQEVSYTLEVSGQSTSRHRGHTTLTGGSSAVLSTMRASVGADWCVKLTAQEAGGAPYEITRGPCDAAGD
jgi:hypothetical protein